MTAEILPRIGGAVKKKGAGKKLSLNRETLQNLDDSWVDAVAAAGPSVGGSCRTVCTCTTQCSFCTP